MTSYKCNVEFQSFASFELEAGSAEDAAEQLQQLIDTHPQWLAERIKYVAVVFAEVEE